MSYYDDSFGWHDDEDFHTDEAADFRRYVQRNSVEKECVGCGRTVNILPQYDVCSPCADKREQGWDF